MGTTKGDRHSQGFHLESSLHQPCGEWVPRRSGQETTGRLGSMQEPNPEDPMQRRESEQLLSAFPRKLQGDMSQSITNLSRRQLHDPFLGENH